MKVKSGDNAFLLNKTIVEVIEESYLNKELLKELQLDICGNEDKSLLQVCIAQSIDENEVLDEISNLKKSSKYSDTNSYHSWSKEFLLLYFKQEHHKKIQTLLGDVMNYKAAITSEQEEKYKELKQIEFYIENISEKLTLLLKFKVEKFYPSAKKFLTGNLVTDGKVRSMEKQVALVKKDHIEISYHMGRMKELAGNFLPPENAENSHRLLYSALNLLNETLQNHHFLEENYLLKPVEKVICKIKS